MSLKKNIVVSYIAQVLNTALGFIASIFITRILGPEGRGDYSIFVNALALSVVWLGFSLPSSIIYFSAGNKLNPNRLFTTMIICALCTTGFISLILPFLFQARIQWLIFPKEYQSFFWQALFAIQFFITQINSLIDAMLKSKKIFIPQAIMSTCMTVIAVLAWVLLYFRIIVIHEHGFGLVIIVTFLLLLPPLLYNLYVLTKKTDIRLSAKILSFGELKQMLRFAFLVYVCNAMQFLSYRMDLWFVNFYHGKAETGIYSLAVSLSQIMWMLPSVLASVLFSYMANSTKEEAVQYLVRYVRFAFYSTLILACIAFGVFYFAIPIIYGSEFSASRIMVGILFLGIVPFSIPIICGNFFAGVNKVIYNFWASFLGFLVCLVLDLLLIPHFKAIGACVATIFSYLTNAVYCLIIVRNIFKTPLNFSVITMLRVDVAKIWNGFKSNFSTR